MTYAETEKEYRARTLKAPSGMTPTGDTPIHTDEYPECIACGEIFMQDPRIKRDRCSECTRKEKF